MELSIERLGLDQADPVFDAVLALLRELGAEAGDLGPMDRVGVRASWEASADRFTVFAARSPGGEIAALATLFESFAIYANGAYGVLDEMYVAPAHRSHGVGKRLISAVLEYGRSKGWSRIEVTAPESGVWARSRAFYERAGFTFAGPKLKYTLR